MSENFIHKEYIDSFFNLLNENEIEYLLIKNIADELPYSLQNGKDIDILVRLENREKFTECMGAHGFLYREPPLGISGGWSFGYQLPQYQFWQLGGIKQVFYIDVCFKLMCKSLSPKMWVPLDESINTHAWQNKEWNETLKCWQMGEKTLFVYLFARCVFDKHTFSEKYIAEIEKRKHLLSDAEVVAMIRTIFYKFTDTLVQLVTEKRYDEIINKYITFVNY